MYHDVRRPLLYSLKTLHRLILRRRTPYTNYLHQYGLRDTLGEVSDAGAESLQKQKLKSSKQVRNGSLNRSELHAKSRLRRGWRMRRRSIFGTLKVLKREPTLKKNRRWVNVSWLWHYTRRIHGACKVVGTNDIPQGISELGEQKSKTTVCQNGAQRGCCFQCV